MFSFFKKIILAIATYYSTFYDSPPIKAIVEKDFFCQKWALMEIDEPDFNKPDPYFSDSYSYKLRNYSKDSLLQEVLCLNNDSSYQFYWRNEDMGINKEEGGWSFQERSEVISFRCTKCADNLISPRIWTVSELSECRLQLKFQSRGGTILKTYTKL